VSARSGGAAPPDEQALTRAGLPTVAEHPLQSPDTAEPRPEQPNADRPRAGAGALTFARLKWTSFAHSCVYLGLLISAFAAGNPEPLTSVLGFTHGVLWILMSLACLTATRMRIVPLRLAVAVAVLGGLAPFFGSFEFIREQRRRRR
jgi:hypothetical protein